TDAQKAKYLPGLVAGETIGAYALSESGSGSDALAARTRATKKSDGSWILDGEKMSITNGGFADVFIVFAQADGDQFTAFIVERAFGVKSGNEEHKMGLHGSSTTPILLQEVKVPAENLLGEIGKGHKVALNTLNFGRFKLGAMCSGGCRSAIVEAAKYAKQRKQFGHAIADFGAIKYKLGEMTARTYALESLMYRTAGLIDATVAEGGQHGGPAIASALEEFAVEASIAKVMGSEVLDYVLDENVQIHGGNGFVNDYAAESAVLRATEAVGAGRSDAALHEAAARTFVNDATQRIQAAATNALAAMAEGDTLRTLLAALRRVLKATPVNTVALRRTLA